VNDDAAGGGAYAATSDLAGAGGARAAAPAVEPNRARKNPNGDDVGKTIRTVRSACRWAGTTQNRGVVVCPILKEGQCVIVRLCSRSGRGHSRTRSSVSVQADVAVNESRRKNRHLPVCSIDVWLGASGDDAYNASRRGSDTEKKFRPIGTARAAIANVAGPL
jgi:hypothetical protein